MTVLKDINCECYLDYVKHVNEEDKATYWRNRGMNERIEYFLEEIKTSNEGVA